MTLCISWVRKKGNCKELIMATDSRLRSCGYFDGCPKIFPLKRNDSVLCFAGDTMYTYPMMIQIQNSIELSIGLKTRGMDITDLRHSLISMVNKMLKDVHEAIPEEVENPPFKFILAGYSWKLSDFVIWRFVYDKFKHRFRHHTPPTIMQNKIDVIGDDATIVRHRIYKALVQNGKNNGDGIDMEPFEVLRDYIRNQECDAIGGAPQMVKLYSFFNINPIAIKWEDELTFMGRRLLSYETLPFPILDPDTLQYEYMHQLNNKFTVEPE